MRSISFLLILITFFACKESQKQEQTPSHPTNEIHSNTFSLHSKMTKSDKRKYFDSNENVLYEVKYKPEGFKLRTSSSELLWKIKLYENKIKISDNEENNNPFEIKIVNSREAKLVKNNAELARLNYNNNQRLLKLENSSTKILNEQNYSPTLLIDVISIIPSDQREIIKQELQRKGY